MNSARFRANAAGFLVAGMSGSLVNRGTGPIADKGEQLELPPLIRTVLFTTSQINIVLNLRDQSCNAFARLRRVSPSCRDVCQTWAQSRGWGESNLRRNALARAEKRDWEIAEKIRKK
jgi:hypothetical protein